MANDLLKEVQTGLQAQKGNWQVIADEVPEASYSWISKVGRGKYASDATYGRLLAVAQWLRANAKKSPRKQAA